MPEIFTFTTVEAIQLVAAPVPVYRLAFARARFSRGAVHLLRRKMSSPPPPDDAPADRTLASIVYLLYLIAAFTAVPMLFGVLLALALPKRTEPLASHRRYMIRTFWIMWAYLSLATILSFPLALLGLPIFGLVALWVAVRAVVGMSALADRRPVPRVASWLA